mmetsp:Transcript_94303/g.152128  ORF Transcript_94303/g.152128 Transcript_94303/m.152128 type:complete len:90 (+) Transcript_94303:81-350(+)
MCCSNRAYVAVTTRGRLLRTFTGSVVVSSKVCCSKIECVAVTQSVLQYDRVSCSSGECVTATERCSEDLRVTAAPCCQQRAGVVKRMLQ